MRRIERESRFAPHVATAVFDTRHGALAARGNARVRRHPRRRASFRPVYSPSPTCRPFHGADQAWRRGVVLPLYQPWRVLEEIGMLDHLTGGRLEIGCASGVPQELIRAGIGPWRSSTRL